jgi:hypothetical protein
MRDRLRHTWRQQISLLQYLEQQGWRPLRRSGREEIAGLCPLHPETHPSFYVNRRKQLFAADVKKLPAYVRCTPRPIPPFTSIAANNCSTAMAAVKAET